MGDAIAMWIGYGVMTCAGVAVLAGLGWVALELFWRVVMKRTIQIADIYAWKRAVANGSWQEPRIIQPRGPTTQEGPNP